jgi:hypothetical protein
MPTTTILKLWRKFGGFQRHAHCEPFEITRHGAFVVMLAERYDWMKAAARRKHRTSNTVAIVIRAVERTEMDPEHDARDELLK